ncbi:MAG: hypothetical protein JNM95_15510 [Chitinophagaceae bacterium]|nr:hypothetical protein [Chitinophagaceae bacterium]
MIRNFFALFVLLALLSACSKQKTNQQTSSENYFNLSVGNYWVYEVYKIENGVATNTNTVDSCFVEKDTLIHENTFAVISKPMSQGVPAQRQLFRDSSGYLVNPEGRVYFNQHSADEVLNSYFFILSNQDSVAFIDERMMPSSITILPAGSFHTKNMRIRYDMFPNHAGGGKQRDMHFKYALGVGLVSETLPFYHNQPYVFERRLLRYHVK